MKGKIAGGGGIFLDKGKGKVKKMEGGCSGGGMKGLKSGSEENVWEVGLYL